MNNAEKTRAVYQAAENFYRTACADDYNFSRKAGKNARSMLAAYVDILKKMGRARTIYGRHDP